MGTLGYFDESQLETVNEMLSGESIVEGIAPVIGETVPVLAPESNLFEPTATLLGLDQRYTNDFDPLENKNGDTLSLTDLGSDSVYISDELAEQLDVEVGRTVNIFLGGDALTFTVGGIIDEPRNPVRTEFGDQAKNDLTIVMPLSQLQSLNNRSGQVKAIVITLKGGIVEGAQYSDSVVDLLEENGELDTAVLSVEPIKKDNLDEADEAGAGFASLFLLLGSFSIIAGILLILMIFVMLAAERKRELGIARAIGTQRKHIIHLFTFEGTPYALLSSAVGSGLGLLFGWAMVLVLGPAFDQFGFPLEYRFTASGMIISYTMGVVLTLAVVFFSARRVSLLNIVRAIRDIPDPPQEGGRSKWGLVFFVVLSLLGLFTLVSGLQQSDFFTYALGCSLAIIGIPLLARRFGLHDRVAYSAIGVSLLGFWLTPAKYHPLADESSTSIFVFILSGSFLVAGGVWLVVFNSDLVLTAIMSLFGRFRVLAPILKTAIAYPLSARFRTGMALAMFALIIFTLALMTSISTTIERSLEDTDRLSGGFDIVTGVSPSSRIDDIEKAVDERGIGSENFTAISAVSTTILEIRQTGKDQEWELIPISGLDAAYLDNNTFQFEMMTAAYSQPSEVWGALKDNPTLAVISPFLIPGGEEGGPGIETDLVIGEDQINLETEVLPDDIFIEMRNSAGDIAQFQVVGVTDQLGFYAPFVATSREALDSQFSDPLPTAFYWFKTASDDSDQIETLAKSLESNFRENGLDTIVVEEQINDIISVRNMFINLMMVFLGLGLVVGIAALGVIAARTVVERRQQIGMLRAIGFRQGMIQFSFLLESSFIALLGIGIGVALGVSLTYQIVPETGIQGLDTYIPWARIGIIVAIAYVASLTTTFLPAYQAARVYPAEALRYE